MDRGQLYSTDRFAYNVLSAIDLSTDKVKWKFSADANDRFVDIIAKDGIIYASTYNKLYALEDNESEPVIKWSKDTSNPLRLTFDSTLLFYRESNKKVAALDLSTGAEKWTYALKSAESTDGKFAVGGNRIYFTVRNPVQMYYHLYALDSATGEVLWTADLGASGLTSSEIPVYKDEKLYLDRHDIAKKTNPGWVTAFNAATGSTLWQYNVATYFEEPLAVNSNSVIALDQDGSIMAVDSATGAQRWKVMYTDVEGTTKIKGSHGIVLTPNQIIVQNNNKLKYFNSTDGSLLKVSLPLTVYSNIVGLYPVGLIENTLLLSDTNSRLFTFGVEPVDTVAPTGTFNLPSLSYLPTTDAAGRMKIPYTISETAFVKIKIIDEAGQVVQQYDQGRVNAGLNEISWDGKNVRGYSYSYGKYYLVMELTDRSGNTATIKAQDKVIFITDNYGLTTRNANLRKGAGTGYEIVRVLPAGTEIKIIGESGDWYQVEYRMLSNVQTGYISKPLIAALTNSQISQDRTGIARQNVNIRTAAGTQYDVKKVIPANTTMKIVGASGDWYYVEYQKDSYYVDSGYVAKYLIIITSNAQNTVHVVQAGDTLWKIAQKYGTTADMLIKLNNLDPNKYLSVGQKIIVLS
ncbi:PQQ-binding-like beta-propeller repeat protein [Paenibacillus sp. sptzw28]|uniref:outer membrane protein assembly factor BamB family protein n=1 Tax=Paenibacillus sp. sptzw28 TaxID=715179 RepID=UPI001C6F2770|nr:PQQ-binding-like beta-propeller repeat protein [Paenibacillus sp. sptzw28]QYR21985.1 PQQ-binding-like beta-propeller repeat protein [Paenibacillus sp. sptzw28]